MDNDVLKGQGIQSRVELLTGKCPLHVGKVVNMFCPVEDIVGCTECISEVHRLCDGVAYIPSISSNKQSSPELYKVKLTMDKMKIDIKALKQNRKDHLKKLEDESTDILDGLKSNRKRIDQHLDKLGQQVRNELDLKLSRLQFQINQEIAELEKQMSVLESHGIIPQAFQAQNGAQLFVSVKQAKATQKENEALMMMMDSRQNRSLNFVINSTLAYSVASLQLHWNV